MIASKEWVHLFSLAQVDHLTLQESDHAPIMLNTIVEKKVGLSCLGS